MTLWQKWADFTATFELPEPTRRAIRATADVETKGIAIIFEGRQRPE